MRLQRCSATGQGDGEQLLDGRHAGKPADRAPSQAGFAGDGLDALPRAGRACTAAWRSGAAPACAKSSTPTPTLTTVSGDRDRQARSSLSSVLRDVHIPSARASQLQPDLRDRSGCPRSPAGWTGRRPRSVGSRAGTRVQERSARFVAQPTRRRDRCWLIAEATGRVVGQAQASLERPMDTAPSRVQRHFRAPTHRGAVLGVLPGHRSDPARHSATEPGVHAVPRATRLRTDGRHLRAALGTRRCRGAVTPSVQGRPVPGTAVPTAPRSWLPRPRLRGHWQLERRAFGPETDTEGA